jgi:hypothetical protein
MRTEGHEQRSFAVAVAGFILALLLQTMTFAFYMGRMSARVDAVEQNTQRLLDLQLRKTAER